MSLVPDPSQMNALEEATRAYEATIDSAMDYLEGRGLDGQVVRAYRLGVVTRECFPEHRMYVGRLAIPYITRAGVVTLRFRALSNVEPKYLTMPGDASRLFNVNQLFKGGDTLVITEGEFDAISVAEYAGVPAVGVRGVSNWSPVFARMIQDFTRVIVVGDGDPKGASFAEGLAEELEGVPVVLPDGEDCNSVLVADGALGLRDALGI